MSEASHSSQMVEDEISLLDILLFLKDGWKTLVGTTCLGLAVGGGAAVWLPAKYEASAMIDAARVLNVPVEKAAVLREKMTSPSYYSASTIAACGFQGMKDPGDVLIKSLKPTIPKQSEFVNLTFKGVNSSQASACLTAVLKDVQRDQVKLAQPQLDAAKLNLQKDKALLKEAEDFVAQFLDTETLFKFGDSKFSSTSLLLATLQSKQSQVLELRTNIQKTELALTAPQTQPAEFAVPIYAPDEKVEPKMALLLALGLLAGGFMGLIGLILRKAYQRLQSQMAVVAHKS